MTRGLSRANLLLIEDDAMEAELVQRCLHWLDNSLQITWVENGMEALRFLQNRDNNHHPFPDLILTDLRNSSGSRIDFLSRLKKSPQFGHIPVAILASVLREQDHKLTSHFAGLAIFPRSLHLNELRATLKLILDLSGVQAA